MSLGRLRLGLGFCAAVATAGAVGIAWILATGSWDDAAPWVDTQLWKDS